MRKKRKHWTEIEVWALRVKYQIIEFDISTNSCARKHIVAKFAPLLGLIWFICFLSSMLSISLSLSFSLFRFLFSLSLADNRFRFPQDAMPFAPVRCSPDHFQRLATIINTHNQLEHVQRILHKLNYLHHKCTLQNDKLKYILLVVCSVDRHIELCAWFGLFCFALLFDFVFLSLPWKYKIYIGFESNHSETSK